MGAAAGAAAEALSGILGALGKQVEKKFQPKSSQTDPPQGQPPAMDPNLNPPAANDPSPNLDPNTPSTPQPVSSDQYDPPQTLDPNPPPTTPTPLPLVIARPLSKIDPGVFRKTVDPLSIGTLMRSPGTVETGFNRPGSDYYHFWLTAPDPNLCGQTCAKDARCRAWTYVKPGIQGSRAVCWLKSAAPAQVADPCCSSGVKK